MNAKRFGKLILLCLSCVLWLGIASCSTTQAIATEPPTQQDYAPYFSSWKGGESNATVQKIINFVTVDAAEIPPEDRIAVFDNDGTLWSEKPLIQGEFIKEQQSFGKGETTDAYIEAASAFLKSDSPFGYPYVGRIYKPMVELLEYLQDNGFQTYICSGGGIDFIRAFSEDYYHIPPERVIGSTVGLEFQDGNPSVLVRGPIFKPVIEPQEAPKALEALEEKASKEQIELDESFFFNDSENKPVSIERYIGKRPIVAVGNSNGDLQMLEYTDLDEGSANESLGLMLLVRHDDEAREGYYEADDNTHVDEALDETENEADWHLISVAEDFENIFLGNETP